MSRALKLIAAVLLAACAAAAQTPASGGEQAEAARLNAEVLKLYAAGKYDEALPLARRVLELREQAAGVEDAAVASALNNLAAIHIRKGKGGEAERLLLRSLAVYEKLGRAQSDAVADVAMQLGLIKLEARDYKESLGYMNRALEVKEKLHGTDGAQLAPVLLNLTDLNFLRGAHDAAYVSLGRALSILKARPPKKDLVTATRLKSYYCPLMALGREENWDLASRVGNVIWRLEEPERAAEIEKQLKERKARGMDDDGYAEGAVLNGKVISKPPPEYPNLAKDQRVAGVVVVKILVDEAGKVIEANALCGHPLLARASVDAARQARFTQTLLSGMPVKVSGIITYNFVLQ